MAQRRRDYRSYRAVVPLVAFSFAPYEEVGAQPNVIVGGTATTNTTLTLSHWPGSPTVPASVQADLSAEMAFRYLDHPDALHGSAQVVSNNCLLPMR